MTFIFLSKLLKRLFKYSLASISTFALDLIIIATVSSFTSIPSGIIVFASFLFAMSINYLLCYHLVYRGTKQTQGRGYVYFILGALVAGLFISFGTEYLVSVFAI